MQPISEKVPLVPVHPYGRSKLAVEHALADCDAAYGLRVETIVRTAHARLARELTSPPSSARR